MVRWVFAGLVAELLLLVLPNHAVEATGQTCPSPETRADVFFLLYCDESVLERQRKLSAVIDSTPPTQSKEGRALGAHRGLNDFETEFWVEFNDGTEDIEPFSDKENLIVSEILRATYNAVLGCEELKFLITVEFLEARVVEFDYEDPVYPYGERRQLQRTSQGTSLYQRYFASGRCRCASDSNLFNDLRARRNRALGGKSQKPTTETYNQVVLEALDAAGFHLDYVRASNTFPLLDCDHDGVYDINRLDSDRGCLITANPTPTPKPIPTPKPTPSPKPSGSSKSKKSSKSSKSKKSSKSSKSKKSTKLSKSTKSTKASKKASKGSKKEKKTKASKKERTGGKLEKEMRRRLRMYL